MQQMQAAANRGARQFRIPAGDYHFGHTRFELRNARNMEVTASGVSFWFGWGGGMRVMTSEGVKWTASEAAPFIIDYDPPVVAQGRVIRTDQLASGRWVDAEFSTDYIMPNRNQTGNIFGEPKVKVAFWDPASRTMRRTPNEAVNVYLDGSTSLAPACEPNTGRNCGTTWRIQMAGRTTAMHRLLRNGDLISMHPRVFPHAIELVACERVVFEDAHIYGGTNIGVVESKGVGSHVYRRIKVTRRPGSANLMSVNADGFHSNSAEEGAQIIDSEIGYTGDDLVNIYGGIGIVVDRIGNQTLLVLDRKGAMDSNTRGGDVVRFHSIKTETLPLVASARLASTPSHFGSWNEVLPNGSVVPKVNSLKTTLNAPPYSLGFPPSFSFDNDDLFQLTFTTDLPEGVQPLWTVAQVYEKSNRGAKISGSWLHDAYARSALAKTDGFSISDTLFQRGAGVYIGVVEINWLEGDLGFARGSRRLAPRGMRQSGDPLGSGRDASPWECDTVVQRAASVCVAPAFATPAAPCGRQGALRPQPALHRHRDEPQEQWQVVWLANGTGELQRRTARPLRAPLCRHA